ncbi:MAG TPA: hypothetical protein VNA19_07515 [Pyrinomonadaceae bacterium]|nr:hypothetical protein [Pyrinomonadaceae bacterium]
MNKLRATALQLLRRPFVRELCVLLAFMFLTTLMTWPWVTRMRDAVADFGDPYMLAWTLWWDYHQTFTDPFNLFHANVFYPYRYTLAFSEHDYGIALLFFPLFALGFRPLSVHSFATFCGFAFSGYGAFRLARTLTRDNGAAWVAGIIFAFIPYRFHLLSHLHYLFAGWIPLLAEALVLFARRRSWRRAAWLGVAFLMNALTCISWFILTLLPLALTAAFLVARYSLARDRDFWLRGTVALGAASLLLLPFMLPYYYVSKLYGFVRSAEETAINSPEPIHWLVAERRNKLWDGFGAHIPGGGPHKPFPGLLPLLLSLAACLLPAPARRQTSASRQDASTTDDVSLDEEHRFRNNALHQATADEYAAARRQDKGEQQQEDDASSNDDDTAARDERASRRSAENPSRRMLVLALDALAVALLVASLLVAGYSGTAFQPFGLDVLAIFKAERLVFLLCVALVARLSLAYPQFLRPARTENLIETIRTTPRTEAFGVGLIWTLTGFLGSLGMNFFVNRVLFDFVPLFRSMRIPTRWAMLCYLGLALLAGVGATNLVRAVARRRTRVRAWMVYLFVCLALLFELRGAPLEFVRGEVFPDEITLRLKATPMRGGLVELPAGGDFSHRYMLRAADHARPLVNGSSSFISPVAWELYTLTRGGPIPARFLELLEELPVSYLVIHNALVAPERRADYEVFLARAEAAGRLRFIRTFEDKDDLYAITKTEPQAQSEAPMRFSLGLRRWDDLLRESPVYLLGEFQPYSQLVYRIHRATDGRLPRLDVFLPDVQAMANGVVAGTGEQEARLESNAAEFAAAWVKRDPFRRLYKDASDEQYVARLFANAGVVPDESERAALVEALRAGTKTRGDVLLQVARNEKFVRQEEKRSLVLFHYFGYLRRDPGDPPDKNMQGFDFWVKEVESSGDTTRLTAAFMNSGEYKHRDEGRRVRDE